MYLLDTNIISDLIRNPAGRAALALADRGDTDVVTSVIVAGELRYGCRKKGSARLTERVEAVLAEIEVLGLDARVSEDYGSIRCDLEARGQIIGGNDLWIAAQARSLGLVLVSDNEGEFSRVDGLQLENWLSA
ncbi:tRNA(fMet)-specific endonuclease VapC (plasmid) [Paracoccaceae bacterium]|nr:tRNA(fMet)-specific endonuclease VapC [Paracoccaceae bacterium]